VRDGCGRGVLGRRLKRETGQALVLVVLALPLFFSFALLVIDGSKLFVEKRVVQNAADALALAASRELPTDGTACAAACRSAIESATFGQKFSIPNDGPASLHACGSSTDTNCYVTPYGTTNANRKVQVRLQRDVSTFFGGVVSYFSGGSFSSFHPAARAAASLKTIAGSPGWDEVIHHEGEGTALFAHSTSCSTHDYTLDVSGNDVNIEGILVSNGSVFIHDNTSSFGELDWRQTSPGNCAAPAITGSPEAGCVSPVPNPNEPCFVNGKVTYTNVRPYPKTYDRSSIPCNFTASVFDWNQNGTVGSPYVIPAGVYCATSAIHLHGNIMMGRITLIAPLIDMSGQAHTFTPYYQDLLAYAYGKLNPGPGEVNCSAGAGHACLSYHGNGDTFDHTTFYVPDGNADLSGNSNANSVKAFFEAETITTHGNTWGWAGTGPGDGYDEVIHHDGTPDTYDCCSLDE
jgi:Flp pilus assembly protein TadG